MPLLNYDSSFPPERASTVRNPALNGHSITFDSILFLILCLVRIPVHFTVRLCGGAFFANNFLWLTHATQCSAVGQCWLIFDCCCYWRWNCINWSIDACRVSRRISSSTNIVSGWTATWSSLVALAERSQRTIIIINYERRYYRIRMSGDDFSVCLHFTRRPGGERDEANWYDILAVYIFIIGWRSSVTAAQLNQCMPSNRMRVRDTVCALRSRLLNYLFIYLIIGCLLFLMVSLCICFRLPFWADWYSRPMRSVSEQNVSLRTYIYNYNSKSNTTKHECEPNASCKQIIADDRFFFEEEEISGETKKRTVYFFIIATIEGILGAHTFFRCRTAD